MARKNNKTSAGRDMTLAAPAEMNVPVLTDLGPGLSNNFSLDQRKISVIRALKDWLNKLEDISETERSAYRGGVIAFAREVNRNIGGVKLVEEVTISDLEEARTRLLDYLTHDATRLFVVNRVLRSLRMFFNWCIDEGYSPLSKDVVMLCLEEPILPLTQTTLPISVSMLTSVATSLNLPAIPNDLNGLDDNALRQLATQYIQALKATPLYRQAQLLQEAVKSRDNGGSTPPRQRQQVATAATADKGRSNGTVTTQGRNDPRIEIH